MNWLTDMLSTNSSLSSAKVINFVGAVNGGLMLAFESYSKGLSPELFAIYLAYCGGNYGLGKYLDTKANNVPTVQ